MLVWDIQKSKDRIILLDQLRHGYNWWNSAKVHKNRMDEF